MRKIFANILILTFLSLALVFAINAAPGARASDPAPEDAAEIVAEMEGHGHFTGYTLKDWKDFGLRAMNFAVFFAILWLLLRKPVREYFRGRKENIARTLEYLETQAANLEEQNQVMRKKLSRLSVERESLLSEYEREGARERDRIIAEARKTAESIASKARVAAEQEIKSAKRRLASETGLLAAKIAREILVNNINDEDKSRLMQDFVIQLTKLPSRK
jgi:F-type H+-transporting ATPase subunit b